MKKKIGITLLAGLLFCNVGLGVGLLKGGADAVSPVTFVYDTDFLTMKENVSFKDDTGKNGVQFTSVRSGKAAEGASFQIAENFTGDFEMDFRVTSKQTFALNANRGDTKGWTYYAPYTAAQAKTMFSDEYNPYLDLKETAITFTSKSDENKYFTVYFRGANGDIAFATTAYVYVSNGETKDTVFLQDENNAYYYGYGLNAEGVYQTNGWAHPNSYHSLPLIYGTSFCNYAATSPQDDTAAATGSNLLKFDAETMKVYINSGVGYNAPNAQANVLLRDLSTNAGFSYFDFASEADKEHGKPATLSAADFEDGYSVSVTYTDVTENGTLGYTEAASKVSNGERYQKVSSAYDRLAAMTIYSINGVSMTGENVETLVDQYKVKRAQGDFIKDLNGVTLTENSKNTVDGLTGLRVRSVQSGTAAEGAGFAFADTMVGNFDINFRVTSAKTYAPAHTTEGWTHYIQNGNQKYTFSDYENPYLDLKEVAFTFTSVTNPDKYFQVYFYGAHGDLAFATTAYAYVPGDKCYKTDEQGNQRFGYALSPNGVYPVQSMNGLQDFRNLPILYGTSFSNFAATGSRDVTAANTVPNMLYFDVETMKIYVNAGTGYNTPSTQANYLIRDLQTNAGASESMILGSLDKSDFANGYTVSVTFTDVTANETVGNSENFGGTDHYVKTIETPYERFANLTVYSINGQKLEYTSETGGKISDSTAPILSVVKKDAGVGEAVDLTPLFYDAASGNSIGEYGKVYYSTDGETYQEIEKTADGYIFTPYAYGSLYVKYEGFKDNVGALAETKIFVLPTVDYIAPELAFKDGVSGEVIYDKTAGFAARPTFSLEDVIITNKNDVKTYVTEIVEVKDPDGQTYQTTFLSFLKNGVYSVTYRVTDSFGNASEITRTVTVDDYSAPVLEVRETLAGVVGNTLDISVLKLTDFGAVSLSVTVSKDGKNYYVGTKAETFKPTEAGVYTVTYKATDEGGRSTTKTATITVTEPVEETKTPAGGCSAFVDGATGTVVMLMLLGVMVIVKRKTCKRGKTE